jgi:putative transposase
MPADADRHETTPAPPVRSAARRTRRRRRQPVQLELPLCTWGGKRVGAGRKRRAARAAVPHRARPEHKERYPVHVTLRVARVPSLRRQALFVQIRRAFADASRSSFRLVHFSVQSDHVHLIVEAHDKLALSRGIAGLSIRFARAVNRELGRSGPVLGERYHARSLTTPREVRNCLVYVLMNFKKHRRHAGGAGSGVDEMSSGFWFDGWKVPPRPCEVLEGGAGDTPPVRAPRTWLAQRGWRRHGLIGEGERPTAAEK